MARPLRPLFHGAVYHISARGNAKQDIYYDERSVSTRAHHLACLSQIVAQLRSGKP